MSNKRVLIGPPPFSPLSFGLLSAAIDRTADAPDHWQMGVTWQSHCPDADGTYDPCLTETRSLESPEETAPVATEPPTKEPTTEFFLRGATPFTVYTRFDCNPIGFWEQAQELAAQALTRVESHQVERIFDTGVAPRSTGAVETAYPHLRADTGLVDSTGATLQSAAVEVTGSPLDIVEAIGRLEDALASCYHGRGVIHVPAVLAAEMANKSLMTRRGEIFISPMGHRIALGTGYSGCAPDGVCADDVSWIYATGAVFYYRSEVRVGQVVESFDRSQNTLQMIAERTYVVGWDCCHLAIPVHVGGIVAGGYDTYLGPDGMVS